MLEDSPSLILHIRHRDIGTHLALLLVPVLEQLRTRGPVERAEALLQ